jgi:hypothetical protein
MVKSKSKSKSNSKTNKSVRSHIIRVRFIRKGDTNTDGSRDDVAKITSVAKNIYKIVVCNVDDDKVAQKEMIVNDCGAYGWLERTLRLLDADFIPFEQYQFDFPMMPSVLIHHSELHHHMDTILESMAFQLENWPTRYQVSNSMEDEMTGIMPANLYFDKE